MDIDTDACEHLNLDIKKVRSIVRRMSKVMLEANDMKLYFFSASSSGVLVSYDDYIVVGNIDGHTDGGDPGCGPCPDGFDRLFVEGCDR